MEHIAFEAAGDGAYGYGAYGAGDGAYGYGAYGDGDGDGDGAYGDGVGAYGVGDGAYGDGAYGAGVGAYWDGVGVGVGDYGAYGVYGAYGYGDGVASVAYYSALTDLPQSDVARRAGAVVALWKSDREGRAANGGASVPVHVGLIQTESGPLSPCHRGSLHATFRPDKWRGERLWIVAMWGDVAIRDDKVVSLKREFLAEIQMEGLV